MTKAQLISGEHFEFINEDGSVWMELHHRDDERNSWATGFYIWFNGKLISSPKTFKAFEMQVEKLKSKYNLKAVES